MKKGAILRHGPGLVFIAAVLWVSLASGAWALEPGLCVNAAVSDISPTSIRVGQEFTVGIQIENCGETLPRNVTFQITSLPTDLTIKEPLLTVIPRLEYATSERFLLYHGKVGNSAKPGTYVIKTRLTYGSEGYAVQKDLDVNVRVIGDEAKLNIASVKTSPVLPHRGDTVELILRIENFGEGTANSVRLRAEHPFQGIKESFIGTLDAGEDGPALFTFIADRAGEFGFPVTIHYRDDFGDNQQETEVNIIVLENETDYAGIAGGAAALLVIAALVFFHFRTRREKDRVIQQLLKGEHGRSKRK